jgi:hypothetical protein
MIPFVSEPTNSSHRGDDADKERILDLDGDGRVSMSESLRAQAGMAEEYAKVAGPKRGPFGWLNRLIARMLDRVDND